MPAILPGRAASALMILLAALLPRPSAAQTSPQATPPIRSITLLDQGAPVVHATVTFDGPVFRVATTDEHGRVTLPLPDGDYHVTIESAGRPSRAETLHLDATTKELTLSRVTDPTDPSQFVHPEPFDRHVPTDGAEWSWLRQVPSIVVDHLDVGGSDAQRQPVVAAIGTSGRETAWIIDGMPVTSITSMGRSAVLASRHLFEDVSAGRSNEIWSDTPGATVGFSLPSGTESRALAYGGVGLGGLTAHTVEATSGVTSYHRIQRDIDGGFQVGSPFRQNSVFAWAGYDVSTPRLDVFTRSADTFNSTASDTTMLHDGAAKIAWNRSSSLLTFTYFGDHKSRDGIDAGPARPQETALDERQTTNLGAVRLQRELGGAPFDVQYSIMSANVSFDPPSGRSTPAYLDGAGVWRNAYHFVDSHTLQHDVLVYATRRLAGGAVGYGAELRRASIDRLSGWPGGQVSQDVGYPVLFAQAVQDRRELGHALYVKAFAEQHWQWDRLTLDAGVLWHRQATSADATSIDANPVAPAALPALSIAAQSNVVVWSLVSPRASLAYRLGGSQVHAAYARYSTPMDAALGADLVGAPMSAVTIVTAIDKNGDHVVSPGDVSTIAGTTITSTRAGSTSTPRTDSFSGGWFASGKRLSVSADVTFQLTTDTNWLHLDGITGANFALATTITGAADPIGSFSAPLYRVDGTKVPASLLQTYEARPGYSRQFLGFDAAVTSRSSSLPWEIGFAGGQTQEHFDSTAAHYDLTPSPPGLDPLSLASPNVDAGDLAYATTDANGQTLFVTTPRCQLFATATIPLLWRLSATPAYFLREGFALPYFATFAGAADASSPNGKSVLLTGGVAAFRLPAVHEVDVRLSRPLGLFGRASTIDVDVFNVLNRATPLARQLDERSPLFNQITEVMSPLTVRIGVRVPIR